ncbi:cyclopropane-fatty-acyl-phospholipid synthase family protein [Pontixanthobacter aestiaquae]|uniref:Methyltransferase domain-containing protein n=1 Tax=Pontixanthobacter aestiaquae TaxID=1509367 RepID=A0A844Z9Q4_9SPHN|nr:cyclopropane-fatty-acyl-phospholipid synthase family protein [Pontixanthobacter aestiaquae]MDN3645241.1 cyclopropane-fatty-acyl-phospholipid synthase family protein [Pontixanthobacter aestiaquae]MXO83757.1 methyltransferase domain-containing protein [Pontixanthobacter aestiaquae]
MSAEGASGGLNRGQSLIEGASRFERKPGLIARLVAPSFHKVLDQIDRGLEQGVMRVHLPDGTTRLLGGRNPGFETIVDLKDWRALMRLATNGSIGWYQAWEAGEWDSPDPVQVLAIFPHNARSLGTTGRAKGPFRWAAKVAHWLNRNSKSGSARNIHAHYDLGNDFYAQWLDPTMSYSSGIFAEGDDLQAAQKRKWAKLSERLGKPDTLLEIGCGWGALAGHFASEGARVTGISLSDAQLAWAREHHDAAIAFRKQDYRDTNDQYDAIVSVEMVEAVGREYWPSYFDCIARNLKPGGRAAIQFITIDDDLFDAYAASADFIQAYIFPGGLLIRNSEFQKLAAERNLEWRDQEFFGLDYARTLKLWRENFDAAVDAGRLPDGFDERFIRLWRFYLMYCEAGFRARSIDVSQVTLVKGT